MAVPVPIRKPEEKTIDRAAQALIRRAEELGIQTVHHRFEAMQPQCGFGMLGLCCRMCLAGPCRIDPFGIGPQRGICGANADTMVARNVLFLIANGCSAHTEHGFHVTEVFHQVGELMAKGGAEEFPYKVVDEKKLRAIAAKLGIEKAEEKPVAELVREVAEKALEDFSRTTEETLNFLREAVKIKL